jgi:hypothetical protein
MMNTATGEQHPPSGSRGPVRGTVSGMGLLDVRGRAAVTFPAPHGTDVVVFDDGDTVTFGRGGSCGVRFGYAPLVDEGVPREAGRLHAVGGRVFVESLPGEGRRTIDVLVADAPPRTLAVGEGLSPTENEFRVVVHGETRTWPLLVAVRRDEVSSRRSDEPDGDMSHDAPTRGVDVTLTPMQERVVRAYLEPLRRGRLEPATHREVAEALSYHPNSVREALYEVWARLFAAGVPMPDVAEKRIAVVEAVRLHGLL